MIASKHRLFFIVLPLVGCQQQSNIADNFKNDVRWYTQQVRQVIPEGSNILALCGPSDGRGFYLVDGERKWIEDSISDGRMALIGLPSGELDMYFRGADQTLYSSRKDGGEVTYLKKPTASGEAQVLVFYAATGVVETHSFINDAQNGPVNLWTASKNIGGDFPIRKVSAFHSRCVEGPIG